MTQKRTEMDAFVIILMAASGYFWYSSVTHEMFISQMYRTIFMSMFVALILKKVIGKTRLV